MPQFTAVAMCVVVGIIGRVIPHVPNVTPMTSLSLFAGSKLKRIIALFTIIITFALSDILLSLFYGYAVFSSWTFFVYSGFIIITFMGKFLSRRFSWSKFPCYMVATTLFYWLWTNCGVWLTSGLYAKNLTGLFSCYVVALPFLRNALIGDFIWGIVVFGVFAFIGHKREWRNWQTRWI